MREITVYNTMTRQKEVFNPVTPGEAKMYVCGVTPYNHPHIGNARPFVTWDVIRRYMKHVGYKVTYVQNFTDVDDKSSTHPMVKVYLGILLQTVISIAILK